MPQSGSRFTEREAAALRMISEALLAMRFLLRTRADGGRALMTADLQTLDDVLEDLHEIPRLISSGALDALASIFDARLAHAGTVSVPRLRALGERRDPVQR